ncbi:acetate/propionate family kinase [Isosphaeraceae bacterium EP7]
MATDRAEQPLRIPDRSAILAINGGSSSIKFALFDSTDPDHRLFSGRVERIGLADPRLVTFRGDGTSETSAVEAPDSRAAGLAVIGWIEAEVGCRALAAIGHRVVHGGPRYRRPEPITGELLEELRRIQAYDPEHLPGEIDLIEAFQAHAPDIPQAACFDTAFHHDMPRVAQMVAIPRRFEALGVRRYGFHGLSYEFLLEELRRVGGDHEAGGRVILAHLGSGASMAAVLAGVSIETTMGFTPTSGLMMGTRSGDLDPGLVRFLMQEEGMTVDQFHAMVNHQSGLLGVSETSPDVRDLLGRRSVDSRAAEAIDLFCHRARQWIGALTATLGGLDTLVFSGGIGENSPEIRASICERLGFLGINLDAPRNGRNESVISTDDSTAKVRVIRTDEERSIARAVAGLRLNQS